MAIYIFNLQTDEPPQDIEDYLGEGGCMEPFDWWNTSGNDYGLFKQAIESDDKSNILFKGEVESTNIKYKELTRILNQFSQEFNVGWRGEFYMIDDDGKYILEAPNFDLVKSE